MKADKYLANKVEATLRSLDNIKRAEAPPFLYTRIQAKLSASNTLWEKLLQFITKPSIALALLLGIILLNGSVLSWKNPLSSKETASASEQLLRQEFAEQYNLAITTFYDYENK